MSRLELYHIITYLSALSTLLPLWFLARLGQLSRINWILLFYLLSSLLTDGASFVIVRGMGLSNVELVHGFTFVEACLIGSVYFELFFMRVGHYVWPILLFCVDLALSISAPVVRNSIFGSVTSIVLLSFSILYFSRMMDDLHIPVITNSPLFWINAALAVYFGATLFISSFEFFVRTADAVTARFVWSVQLFSNILFHLLLAIGIWKSRRELQPS